MTKIPTLIVDDERLARINLKKLLESYTSIEIINEADSVHKAIQSIKRKKPQLIFLDIQLIGETGFDLLEKIDSQIQIIFVTAYDSYAIRAFEINAVDYLLKPVNPKRLKKTIERIMQPQSANKISNKKFNYNDAIYVKLDCHTSKFVKIDSIMFISSAGNYTCLVVNDGTDYIVLKTIKQWEDELPDENFLRIHRSTIVNIDYIMKVEKNSSKQHWLFLKDYDKPFEISRRCYARLKANFEI